MVLHKKKILSRNGGEPAIFDITPGTLEALRAGDHEAFDQVYLRFFPPLKLFLTALLGSAEQAEDTCQELFAHVWLYRHQVDPEKNFKSFLYTTARNLSMNYFRGKKVRDDHARVPREDEEEGDNPHAIVVASETELLIKLIVNRMPARRKKIFEMSRFEGKSNDEISRLLRVQKNAVEKQLSFAMKEIRATLP
jgi:RNA polymerase sigma-70 factor (ECF subfamily)